MKVTCKVNLVGHMVAKPPFTRQKYCQHLSTTETVVEPQCKHQAGCQLQGRPFWLS